jgi:hypothetical protein
MMQLPDTVDGVASAADAVTLEAASAAAVTSAFSRPLAMHARSRRSSCDFPAVFFGADGHALLSTSQEHCVVALQADDARRDELLAAVVRFIAAEVRCRAT